MVRLRILEILTEQNHTKYWLFKRMDMSYQNFNKIVNNETSSIRFDNIDKLSRILNVPIGDLFYQTTDDFTESE
jgi:DNA-binding Xre family transcriptional regulator